MVSSKLERAGPEAARPDAARSPRYTFGLAILLTAFQAFGVASALQNVPNLVSDPGALFLLVDDRDR